MSLMNDALRKKTGERLQSADRFDKPGKRFGAGRVVHSRVVGVGLVLLLIAIAGGIYGYYSLPFEPARLSSIAAQGRPAAGIEAPDEMAKAEMAESPPIGPVADRQGPQADSPVDGSENSEVQLVNRVVSESKEKNSFAIAEKGVTAVLPIPVPVEPSPSKAVAAAEKNNPPDSRVTKENLPEKANTGKGATRHRVPDVLETAGDPAELYYQKALTLHRQKRPAEAIRLYLTALQQNPEHRGARFNLAAAYLETASFSEAYAMLSRLSAAEPENPEIRLNLAVSEIGLGHFNEALSLLEEAEAKNAPAFEVCFHRGVIYSRLHQPDEALRWYRKAEAINSQHAFLMKNMALAYDRLTQYQPALKYYRLYLDYDLSSPSTEKKAVDDRIRALKSYLGRQPSGRSMSEK